MRATALRIYGKEDLRLETFTLPAPGEGELLVKVVCDSLCMSSYKAAKLGPEHKRIPDDVAQNPTVLGHEFCCEIVEVGPGLEGRYAPGQKMSVQPALRGQYEAVGYSYPLMGGDTTYGIIPAVYTQQDNVLPYEGDAWFYGALAEPLSCVIGAVHACYHTELASYVHHMDIKEGGRAAVLAGAGPMGLALIDYLLHRDRRPATLVVTDIDDARLARAAGILTVEDAAAHGVALTYLNTAAEADPVAALMALSGGEGYDEVHVFAPVAAVVQQADAILAHDGNLDFFAGPADTAFSAPFNFFNVHYNATHITGTSGGNTDDMREALAMAGKGQINPAILVTHIGGLDAAREATLNLPSIPGGKKLLYTHLALPLTSIGDFAEKGKTDPLFAALDEICARHGGLWSAEAERYLLANGPAIDPDDYIP